MQILPPKKVVIKKSPIHGYGVFALYDIEVGEVIEECPLYLLPLEKGQVSDCMIDYRYNYPKQDNWTHQSVAWGYGSLYNHSINANADWRDNKENETFEFYATKYIKSGEEIFIYYGGVDYWNDGRIHTDVK